MKKLIGKNNITHLNRIFANAIKHWAFIAPILSYPSNDEEYEELLLKLDKLLELVKNNENHPLVSLVDILSNIISSYEEKRFPEPIGKGIDALKYFIKTNKLRQSDFPEIGSQGVVSEILNGKRSLNLRQIKLLAKRFHVSSATFVG